MENNCTNQASDGTLQSDLLEQTDILRENSEQIRDGELESDSIFDSSTMPPSFSNLQSRFDSLYVTLNLSYFVYLTIVTYPKFSPFLFLKRVDF